MVNTAINRCPSCGSTFILFNDNVNYLFGLRDNGYIEIVDPENKDSIIRDEEEKLKTIMHKGIKMNFQCGECCDSLWGTLVSKKDEPLKFKLWSVLDE